MDIGNTGLAFSEAAEDSTPRQWKSSENSIWVALDFPRVCVETLIASSSSNSSSLDCESLDPGFRSDMFSCLLENARRRLEEAITGSCKKPCCADSKAEELVSGGGGDDLSPGVEWAGLRGLRSLSHADVKHEPSVSYLGTSSSSSIWATQQDCFQSDSFPGSPHEGLFFVLPFLMLKDLLSVEQACKSLRDAVAGDTLLWRNLKIDYSLSTKLTDESLVKLASRAQGRLQSLMLIECMRISDESVEQVVSQNPMISKIFLPGCIRVSVDAVVRMVEFLQRGKTSGSPGVKQVKIRGLTGLTKDNLERLQALLGVSHDKQRNSKPHHYLCGDVSTAVVDERIIDVEVCPRCNQPRAVYDCPRTKCGEWRSLRLPECRGCIFCIPRCEECGRCIDNTDYEETFCLRLLCSDCWLRLPKCLECNRPGCESSAEYFTRRPDAMFVCPDCQGAYKSGAGAGLEFYVI